MFVHGFFTSLMCNLHSGRVFLLGTTTQKPNYSGWSVDDDSFLRVHLFVPLFKSGANCHRYGSRRARKTHDCPVHIIAAIKRSWIGNKHSRLTDNIFTSFSTLRAIEAKWGKKLWFYNSLKITSGLQPHPSRRYGMLFGFAFVLLPFFSHVSGSRAVRGSFTTWLRRPSACD